MKRLQNLELNGDYTDYPDFSESSTFVLSGPIGKEEPFDIFGVALQGRGGRQFPSLEHALSWVQTVYTIVEVINESETYGSRWAVRVKRLVDAQTRKVLGKNGQK